MHRDANASSEGASPHAVPHSTARLALAAVGVVYGDIGTSPLYALRECFRGPHGVAATPEAVLGVLSLMFWALTLVVALKYLTFLMRADNEGEGGILALLALAERRGRRLRHSSGLVLIGVVGASLLYGDGVITPAISVLSAVEGLELVTPAIHPFIVPLAIAVLVALFSIQRRGTEHLGSWFGPITLVWFACIGAAGIPWILREPGVLAAIDPRYGLALLVAGDGPGLLLLGAVVLCVTGCEALYTDMGHFGRRPISLAWYCVAFPALLLSYFGQGAFVLQHPELAQSNTFFELLPSMLVVPMVILATLATSIASQAVISGTFSLTSQAVQLGLLPRMRILHTSPRARGQIYVPAVNAGLFLVCVALVVMFRSSSGLAAAYGMAVTGAMTATSLLFFAVARRRIGLAAASILSAAFLFVDLSFLISTAAKILDGAWLPLLIGGALLGVMTSWRLGTDRLARQLAAASPPITRFVEDVRAMQPQRVRGTAVFMAGQSDGLPVALGHHFKHTQMLHERIVLLTISAEPVPWIDGAERVTVEDLGEGFVRVVARYGFMQAPRMDEILRRCARRGLEVDVNRASFFLGRVSVVASTTTQAMRPWRRRLYAFLHRNAQPAFEFFGIPPGRVVELGLQVAL